jgi:hypothetical protein
MSFAGPRSPIALFALAASGVLVWSESVDAYIAAPIPVRAWGMLDALDVSQLGEHEDNLLTRGADEWALRDIEDGTVSCAPFFDGEPRLTLFDDPLWREPPAPEIAEGWHTDRHGEPVVYDHIPLRWDRPTNHDAYVYPVAHPYGVPAILSAYDLGLPNELQRRSASGVVGHGGIDLLQVRGAPIRMIRIAHQVGNAELLYVGPLFGNTVVTKHARYEGGERRHYVLIFGHLLEPAPGLMVGQSLREGQLIGRVGASEVPEVVHLHLEARRIRDEVDGDHFSATQVLSREATVVTDPRNVLPLKADAAKNPSCTERRAARWRTRLVRTWNLALERPDPLPWTTAAAPSALDQPTWMTLRMP